MTPTVNLEAGAGDLVERLRTFLRQDDPEIDVDAFKMLSEAAAQLAAVTAENARLRERIEQAYKAGFDFAMLTDAPK